MFRMQAWQGAVVAVVAVGCVGYMAYAIVGMFSRKAVDSAVVRRATPFESGLVSGEAPAGARAFDVWSYRVSARLAGKGRIVVSEDRVAVAAPRVPASLYQAWTWAQGILLALVPAALVWALLRLDWRPALLGLAVLVVSLSVSSLGAGVWPGLGEMEFVGNGAYQAIEFPCSDVSDVAVGEGWARGGMDVVLLPYKKGIDAMSEGHCVSFFAPDESGREVRYALHLPDAADATELAALLRSAD